MTNHHGRKKRLRGLRERAAELESETEQIAEELAQEPEEPEEAPVVEEAPEVPLAEGMTYPEPEE